MSEPDWDQLRDDGRVIWEGSEGFGLAVYAGDGGDVVILSVEDGRRSYATLSPGEMRPFMAALARAAKEADEIGMEMDVAYTAFLAIEKARGD